MSKKVQAHRDTCRFRKVKCDLEKPDCKRCRDRGNKCTYSLQPLKKARTTEYAALLERRIEALEAVLAQKTTRTAEVQPPSEVREPEKAIAPTLGTWSYTHLDVVAPNVRPMSFPEILEHLVEIFFEKVTASLMMVHRTSFVEQFRAGKAPELLLYSMCALAARYSPYLSLLCTKNKPAGKPFSERATLLFKGQLDKGPVPSTIQSGLLLGTYEFAAGNGEMAIYFLSITHRAAQYTGLNFVDSAMFYNPVNPNHLSVDELECRRRIWWECMATDVISATLFGRPLGIDDRDYVVNLPDNDMKWLGLSDQYYFRRLLSALICAWREVFRFTQHRHLRKWFRNDVITATITKLEQPLLEYAQHLPPGMEYRSGPPTVSPAHHSNTAVLHCVYWLIIILLHRSHIAHGISNKCLSASEMHSKKQCIDAAYQIATVFQDFESFDDCLLDIFSSFAAFNAATIFVNIAYTANIASATQAQQHLRLLRSFLRHASRVWAMNHMFIEILRLMEQLFRRKDPPAARDSSSIDWLVPTSTSYFQWYFANISPT
ncbi:hypothetical protein DSO57_1036149 [Entomophthora muscae]|uniref:Uncharacterized protein n=1 Tax=Entomophthora muscae TaxID=34485 RepID=A0ACC2U913_9FUNG|nr:hypothetical protein DSO57_1036149 [Entomophthora muscae]